MYLAAIRIATAVNTAEMKDMSYKQALEPNPSTTERFAELIRNEIAQNAELLSKIKLKK